MATAALYTCRKGKKNSENKISGTISPLRNRWWKRTQKLLPSQVTSCWGQGWQRETGTEIRESEDWLSDPKEHSQREPDLPQGTQFLEGPEPRQGYIRGSQWEDSKIRPLRPLTTYVAAQGHRLSNLTFWYHGSSSDKWGKNGWRWE